jgi:hypothetical protein
MLRLSSVGACGLTAAFYIAAFCMTPFCNAADGQTPLAESYLLNGDTAGGILASETRLAEQPEDTQTRFGLGVLRFVAAVEHLGQNFYRYGLRDMANSVGNFVPLLRLPVPTNPNPETFTYADSRRILQTFLDELAVADATLGAIDDPSVKLPLHVTRMKLDFTGDRRNAVAVGTVLMRMRAINEDRDLFVTFDRADAIWLRGYCNLLSAFCQFALAHDGQEIFDSTAHLFFKKVDSPYPFLQEGRRVFEMSGDWDIADLIAFVHLIRMPVAEPERMKAALDHLETVLRYSGEMWQAVVAEADDDHEWIPNPKQRGALGITVDQAMIDGWLMAVKEGNEVLQGRRLIPFWRGQGDQGLNLRRVFTEPTPFDLVLWIQGTAAAPYLESGEMTRPEVWSRLQQVFRGQFIVFAVWFN